MKEDLRGLRINYSMGTQKDFIQKAIDHLVDNHIEEFEKLIEMYRARELNKKTPKN